MATCTISKECSDSNIIFITVADPSNFEIRANKQLHSVEKKKQKNMLVISLKCHLP